MTKTSEYVLPAILAFAGVGSAGLIHSNGNWIYVTLGVDVQIGNGMNIQAEVKLPVHRALANRQLDSTGVLQFGISRSF